MEHISEVIHNHYLTRLLNLKLRAKLQVRGGAGGARESAKNITSPENLGSLQTQKLCGNIPPPTSLKVAPYKSYTDK